MIESDVLYGTKCLVKHLDPFLIEPSSDRVFFCSFAHIFCTSTHRESRVIRVEHTSRTFVSKSSRCRIHNRLIIP